MIKYEDMNRNLGLVYTFSRWFHEHPNSDETSKMDSRLQVPFVCEFVAMRWSYEELVVAQAKLNPLTKRQEDAQRQIDAIVARHESNPADSKRLDDLKETLAVLSGLEARTPRELQQYLVIIDRVLSGKMPFERVAFKNANGPITAEQLYVNQKISDLIANAEMEQNDYRRGGKPNVFFGAQKHYFGTAVSVFTFNTAVLLGSSLLLLWLLHWILRRQLEVRRN
jgi:ABC transport system ATP-binding/permease protein